MSEKYNKSGNADTNEMIQYLKEIEDAKEEEREQAGRDRAAAIKKLARAEKTEKWREENPGWEDLED